MSIDGEPLALVRAHMKGDRQVPTAAVADPIARVLVDVPLAHLDRPFDYLVPEPLADQAVPGARVKVRFAGQDVDGFVVERVADTEHQGRLAPLRRVVSPEPVLTPEVLALARFVARRYAGSVMDVVRLAVPPRHATAERAADARLAAAAETEPAPAEPVPTPAAPAAGATGWRDYRAGTAFLTHLAEGGSPAASWLALPGTGDQAWPALVAEAARTALAAGRGVLVIAPDTRDVDRLDVALTAALGKDQHVRLTAAQGPQARYTAFLKTLRGEVRCVVGSRAAMFAPVQDLGLVVWWDDGDDLLAEPRAPYPQAREVLLERARATGAAVLSAGFSRSVAMQQEVEEGRCAPVVADAATVRRRVPRVLVAGEGVDQQRDAAAVAARLPSVALQTAREALTRGPVLVQVPRRGYLPALSCQTCRAPARCQHCHGPLELTGRSAQPRCRWCGRSEPFECPHCEGHQLRSAVVGARRTAEELGRAFPGVPVITSGGDQVVAEVGESPALVIATPGAEPVATSGYAAVLLLDAWALLDRPELDAGPEALRRWLAAAALAHGSAQGGVVVLVGAPTELTLPPVEALVRWDPAWLAARELDERRELRLPPTVTMARLEGERRALAEAVRSLALPPQVDQLGPLPAPPDPRRRDPAGAPGSPGAQVDLRRMLLRVDRAETLELADRLRALRAVRSARKDPDPIAVRVDPAEAAL